MPDVTVNISAKAGLTLHIHQDVDAGGHKTIAIRFAQTSGSGGEVADVADRMVTAIETSPGLGTNLSAFDGVSPDA